MKILIVGGYGTFGGRLAQLLDCETRLTLVIAGRSQNRGELFCRGLPGGAQKYAACFDRDGDVEAQLRLIMPTLVVDASGPFQSYGVEPYRVVQACIAIGIDYMDLADGSEFVAGIARFDAAAKARGIYILSGVSSFPVLTAAVVSHLSRGLENVSSITGGIAPSPYAGVGLNVIRAIASYAGKPIALVRNRRHSSGYGLTESIRYTVAPPGLVPLNNTRFSLVDVPDLNALPQLWPGLDSIWMGAGPVPEILQRMLNALAWLVRLRLLPSLGPLASIFHFVTNTVRWGEHRGGMFVSIEGDHRGRRIERSWHLLAEGEDGPFIPSMAIEAIIRHSLTGRSPQAGARAATGELELADYQEVFKDRQIFMGCRETPPLGATHSLYRKLLGDAWGRLPAEIRALHERDTMQRAEGVAVVDRGDGFLSRLIGWLFGFPAEGADIPVRVDFRSANGGELWRRTFGGKSFSSCQTEGTGRSDRLLSERFGPFSFDMALVVHAECLSFIVRRWNFLGLPLPKYLAPSGNSYEFVADGRFCFHVEIKLPLAGLIVRYSGWLESK